MKILNWLTVLLTLGVIGTSYGLYRLEPTLVIGTPWGSLHVAYLLAGGFAAGGLVMGFFLLANWWGFQRVLRRRGAELRKLRGELEALRQAHPEEVVRIPDRPEAP
ncbi:MULTISPECIES: LapA family protein [unclassified Meiothermus]|uniref:LapA family protein n=1 Tax=unclassified Meiothermus TaxID=370471 RepID=UPI000D7BFCB9|nr:MULTISPECIES: LapA family protein [unclassified Meiothermus]PZA06593.1 LapA family protein [Meiothermus sp. Pnk-1]RYM37696.1 LapA family protein [Meiothermus sp. PNK-Is4]